MRALGNLLVLLLLLLVCLSARAQDTLVTVHGQEMPVKLRQLTPEKVVYQTSAADSVLSEMAFKELFMIKLGNGQREVYPQHLEGHTPAKTYTAAQLRLQARRDVARYQNYTSTGLVTGVVSTLYPPVGLVVALASGKPRTIYANEVSDPSLLNEHLYLREYKAEAQRRKRGARFIGFAAGASVMLTLVMLANSGGN